MFATSEFDPVVCTELLNSIGDRTCSFVESRGSNRTLTREGVQISLSQLELMSFDIVDGRPGNGGVVTGGMVGQLRNAVWAGPLKGMPCTDQTLIVCRPKNFWVQKTSVLFQGTSRPLLL